jgi:hypothetical protein
MQKARNMIIDGYRKGVQLQKDKYGLFFIFNGRNPLNTLNIESYNILTEQTSKDTISTVGRGLIGSALFGYAGTTAALTGKENKIYTIKVYWDKSIRKDANYSIFELDEEFYKVFMATCARTEQDQKEIDYIHHLLHPDKYPNPNQEQNPDTNNENSIDIKSKLAELKSIYEEGLITEEEYSSKKQELLKKM